MRSKRWAILVPNVNCHKIITKMRLLLSDRCRVEDLIGSKFKKKLSMCYDDMDVLNQNTIYTFSRNL